MARLVEVTELALRDGHQSLLATRVGIDDLAPICGELERAGYWSVECWGGATYDACIRFLNEDPWARLRAFRKLMPTARLQMLLRGQNLLGYRHYEDEVVDRFVERSAANGIDVFRVFDALNDPRNIRRALEAVRRTGKHAQGTLCFTTSPLHGVEGFVDLAEELREMGADSICVKDMAALLRPQAAFDLVRAIKERCGEDTPVFVHTHATTGVTLPSLLRAIEAGADGVDACISSLALGPGHNPTEAVVEMLEGMPFTTRLDRAALVKIQAHFAKVRRRYAAFESKFVGVETGIFESQIPGGMISNMESQLAQQGAGDRVPEVMAEVPRVRQDAGFPPLVTPTSQIVGTQAVLNVLMGRYQVLTGEFADLLLGYYGATPGPRDPTLVEAAGKQARKPPISARPADRLAPEWETLRAQALVLPGCDGSDEDVLTYAMFPQVAPGFFAGRAAGPKNLGKDPEAKPAAAGPEARTPGAAPLRGPVTYEVRIGGRTHEVVVAPGGGR